MAVYTQVSEDDLKLFLTEYDIGTLVSYEGIEQGVSNTNYFVTTDQDRFVLTLFEPHRVDPADIPHFIDYAIRLEKDGVPCPRTILRRDGKSLSILCDRPAALFSILHGEGGSVAMLTPDLCEKAGATLGQMHRSAMRFSRTPDNHFGPARWQSWNETLGSRMDEIAPGMRDFIQKELDFIFPRWPKHLMSGAIHADYFPDNVFFENGNVTGVIDFHFVCKDLFAYDLAIALNAWSFDAQNEFCEDRMIAFVRGYESARSLPKEEIDAMPLLLRAAALRFLLSRIEEKLKWKPGDFMIPHDPMVFEKRLRHFQEYDA